MSDFVLKLSGVPEAPREYECPEHGPFEIVVDLATSRDPRPCPECGAASERTLSTNLVTTVCPYSFVRGKSDPPPNPMVMDTRPLAEGMPLKEWRKKNRAKWRGYDRDQDRKKGAP